MPLVRIALSGLAMLATLTAPSIAGASTPPRTTVVDVTARCETLPRLPGAPGPVMRQFRLEVTTPRHVRRHSTATVSAEVNYQVSGLPQVVGGIAVQAVQSGAATLHFITVGPGASSISGSVQVPVTARAGRTIQWTIPYFGQAGDFGGVQVADTCVPTQSVVLPETKVTG
jgi:hypothetical protein